MTETIVQFMSDNWISFTTMALTILWLILEYKASMWLWPVGIILPVFWIIVSFGEKVYGNVIINTYYLITSIIGWIMWLRAKSDGGNDRITSIDTKSLLVSSATGVFFVCTTFFLMMLYTDNSTIMCTLDSIATILSFIGMIWLSKKWWQHWICWIIANSIYSVIFGINGDFLSTITFIISTIVAILGLRKWYGMMVQKI